MSEIIKLLKDSGAIKFGDFTLAGAGVKLIALTTAKEIMEAQHG